MSSCVGGSKTPPCTYWVEILAEGDISTSQNNKDRGQERFCDDGSKQKRSPAKQKSGRGQRERERSDRVVDGGG